MIDGPPGLDVPGLLHIDHRQVPLERPIQRIVGDEQRVHPMHDLGVFDAGILVERLRDGRGIFSGIDGHDVEVSMQSARGDSPVLRRRSDRVETVRHLRLSRNLTMTRPEA